MITVVERFAIGSQERDGVAIMDTDNPPFNIGQRGHAGDDALATVASRRRRVAVDFSPRT